MSFISLELQKHIEQQKRKGILQEKRFEERKKAYLDALANASKQTNQEEDTKKTRRRPGADKNFKGCTEEEAEEDLQKIFNREKADKYMHTRPDGRTMAVIKKQLIVEGDYIRIEKGDAHEAGVVKAFYRGVLIIEGRDRERKYAINKLLSSRYSITVQKRNK
ncbi:hypothetical protein NEOKW01_0386 [Nematocida sp. AWRm80]|nr:hypothetical protein NEOKW01_0386 [Nematocida sp. AWRm80]